MRQVFLDTETTGLSAATGDRLVEVAAIGYDGRRPVPDDEFHSYLNPHRDVPMEAQKIHGLSADFLADKPDFPAIADMLCDFLRGADVIIHNAAFDLSFLNAEFALASYNPIETVVGKITCSLNLSRRLNVGFRRHSLDALCAHFNVNADEREKGHNALLDVRLLGQVYLAMTRGQVAMNMQSHTPTETNIGSGDVPVRLADESEQAAHEKTLDAIEKETGKKPLWLG